MASQTRNPIQVNSDGKTSWQSLHKQGHDCFKKSEFRSAADYYTEAIKILEREIGLKDASVAHMITDIESRELADLYAGRALCWWMLNQDRKFPELNGIKALCVRMLNQDREFLELYGYRAQCWRMLNQDRECLEDAQKSVDYDAKWFCGHLQLGCALSLQGKDQLALSSLVQACNNWTPADGFCNAVAMIEALLDVMSLEKETSVDLKRLNARFGSDIWARVAVEYLVEVNQSVRSRRALTETQRDKLTRAELANQQIQGPASTQLDVDLSKLLHVLCCCTLRWAPSLILFLVESGTNIHTFTEGTWPYLHSVIWMVIASGCSPFVDGEDSDAIKLVKWVLQKEVQVNGDWNLRESQNDKTVLHFLALWESQRGFNEEMILHLAKLFLEGGTDPLLKDGKGRTAIECSVPYGKLYNILKRFSQQGRSKKRRSASRQQTSVVTGVQKVKSEACEECVEYLEAAERTKERNLKEAYKTLVAVLDRANTHTNYGQHSACRAEAKTMIVDLLCKELNPSIPRQLLKIDLQSGQELLEDLARGNQWRQMEHFVSKLNKTRRKGLTSFASNMSLIDLATSPNLCGDEDIRMRILDLLLTHRATFDPSEAAKALTKIMEHKEFKMALKFLELGVDPKGLSFTPGDTPNHAALVVAVDKEKGNFKLFDKLQDMHQSDPEKYSYLGVSCQDSEGNTPLHLVSQLQFSHHSLDAVKRLIDCQAPLDVRNHAGKLPQDCITNTKDERLRLLKSKVIQPKQKQSLAPDAAQLINWEATGAKPKILKKNAEFYRAEAEYLLKNLERKPISNRNEREEENSSDTEKKDETEEEEEREELNIYNNQSEASLFKEDEAEGMAGVEDVRQDDYETEIDVLAFDNYPWEVECTEEVWDTLRAQPGEYYEGPKNKRKPNMSRQVKELFFKTITVLASGQWDERLRRRVEEMDVPPDMKLYQIDLPKGACIFWELALAFSERETHREKQRLGMESIKIYSEVIRVWSIVLKPAEKKNAMEKIAVSFRRGQDCILKKELTVLRENKKSQQEARSPTLYVQTEDQQTQSTSKDLEKLQQLCHPASYRKNDFHILKFYSFSSSLVSAILSQSDLKIELPFRVTEIEHEYINLETDAPFLLLGRSGTGKTTCCLYRIWNHCLHYWQEVEHAGGKPLIAIEFADEDTDNKDNEANDTIDNVDHDQNADADQNDDVNQNDEETEYFCHLRQIFVTKNPILCDQVEKNFRKLQHACKVMTEHNELPRQPLPNTLMEVEDLSYPLFLTSRMLLIMLDASVDCHESVDDGKPFFPRDEYLGLRYPLPGWGNQDDPHNIFPSDQARLPDSSDEEEAQAGRMEEHNMYHAQKRGGQRSDPHRECTYKVFVDEVWPKIAKTLRNEVHPSLVWTEIMSFIKGSYEALNCDKGYLPREQYMELGRKRAPTFSGDRNKVYDVFLRYVTYKREHHLFDEPDVVFKIYTRLQKTEKPIWSPHEIYVDETQDFTQAELALLVSIASSPNKMFLSGDTAQGIMRGISFRFEDLKSLFFFEKDSDHPNRNQHPRVLVPKVHHLTYNYRSHCGILSLASSVLDILRHLFPESFDLMERDQGMFDGPKPVLIDTDNEDDLAMLLSGNRRDKSNIEFGAHQAILVVNEEAREALPKELKDFIVLTIFESKGLEFDDILLYNFFTNSQADTEWRVVTEVLRQILANDRTIKDFPSLDRDWFKTKTRSRPLQFDPNKHKVLTSELKQLYTALTRARVNIWIFDQNRSRRAPMFEYFQALGLVRSIGTSSQENLLDGFSVKSTPREWRKKGDMFMSKELYKSAAQCYRNGGREHKANLADAYQESKEARDLPKHEQKVAYLKVGVQFLVCGDLQRAYRCFIAADEFKLANKTAKKNDQFQKDTKQPQEQAGLDRVHMERLEERTVKEDPDVISEPTDILQLHNTEHHGQTREGQRSEQKGPQGDEAQKSAKKKSHQQRKQKKKKRAARAWKN